MFRKIFFKEKLFLPKVMLYVKEEVDDYLVVVPLNYTIILYFYIIKDFSVFNYLLLILFRHFTVSTNFLHMEQLDIWPNILLASNYILT